MSPRVRIIFETGAIDATLPSEDSITGLCATGVAVASTFALGTTYLITKPDGLLALGITSEVNDANATIYKAVKEFYDYAPEGTKLYIMGFADTVTIGSMTDVTNVNGAKKLIDAANGEIRILLFAIKDAAGFTPVILDGLETGLWTALTNAQALAEYATESKYAPLFCILEARRYGGTASALRNLLLGTMNRVGVVLADTVTASLGAAVGLVGGCVASIPVQRSIMRVKNGAIPVTTMYIGSNTAENGDPDVISDKGYITARTFVGKSGYYWAEDRLATEVTDDYSFIQRRRVIDKAYRIAYLTALEELGDEIPVNDDGTLPFAVIKNYQQKVELAIINNMTAVGNLGNVKEDPEDNGVEVFIDHRQNVVSTKLLTIQLRVKPHGYPKFIDISLGFKTTSV